MVYADSLDTYEVRRMAALTGEGMKTLAKCYLPLVGTEALGVYFALYHDPTWNTSSLQSHESFYRRTLVTSGTFERSMKALEAIGLVRTFVKKGTPVSYYVYCLYAPLEPYVFLDDPLLGPSLEKVVGKVAMKNLRETFPTVKLPDDMEETTTDFASFFKPDFVKDLGLTREHQGKGNVPLAFSPAKFNDELAKIGIDPRLLSDSELDRAAKIATFYELDEVTMASFCFDCYHARKGKGSRLDFLALSNKAQGSLRFRYIRKRNLVKSEVSSTSALAQKIQLMDETKPYAYLAMLQGGNRPPASDARLLERLSIDIGLPSPCINVVIDYVLEKNDNVLSSAYCEKIAGALVREGCQSARDAMDYLTKVNRQRKEKTRNSYVKPAKTSAKPQEKQEEVSNEEIDALLDELYGESK